MAWTYEIETGRLFRPDGTLAGTGYAGGECGLHPEAVNNPAFCNQHSIGPLPPGEYTIARAITHPRLGPIAMALNPNPKNTMFGRSGFYLHADLVEAATKPRAASDGCIVQSGAVRKEVDTSTDRDLIVVPFVGNNILG